MPAAPRAPRISYGPSPVPTVKGMELYCTQPSALFRHRRESPLRGAHADAQGDHASVRQPSHRDVITRLVERQGLDTTVPGIQHCWRGKPRLVNGNQEATVRVPATGREVQIP